MNKRAQLIGGIIFNTIITLVITKLAVGSLNPLDIFYGDSLFLKILVSFFMVITAFSFLGLIALGKLADQRCAGSGCGRPLMAFADAMGTPVRCLVCGRWFHRRCLKAGGGSAITGCQQPGCPSARTEHDSFSDSI